MIITKDNNSIAFQVVKLFYIVKNYIFALKNSVLFDDIKNYKKSFLKESFKIKLLESTRKNSQIKAHFLQDRMDQLKLGCYRG